MSETTYSVSFITNYKDTDFTREYVMENIDSVSAATEVIRNKVNSINQSLESGTATVLANMFVADDYDSTDGTGSLVKISGVKVKSVVERFIPQPATETRELNPDEFPDEFKIEEYIPEMPTIEGGDQK